MSAEIEQAIERDEWIRAQKLIERRLRSEPDSHWLLTRLSLTYYERHDYASALPYSERAVALAPNCPLVLWDYAGTLAMLGRTKEALALFRRLVRRGIDSIANDDCGEGVAWSRGLVADCHYRMAHCYLDLRRKKEATHAFTCHLNLRGPGCRSIYPIQQVRKEFADVVGNAA